MKQNKEILKKHFETGDKPTQEQYADLIDSYVDSKQPSGEANRRFVIDEKGEVSVASEKIAPVYTLSDIVANKLSLLKDGEVVKEIDLTTYVDDTNLSRLVSGTVDKNGLATFTRDDNSMFTVDLSNLKGVVPQYQAGTNISIDNTNPLQPVINSSGGGDNDNLGDHIATQNLDMANYQILNVERIEGKVNNKIDLGGYTRVLGQLDSYALNCRGVITGSTAQLTGTSGILLAGNTNASGTNASGFRIGATGDNKVVFGQRNTNLAGLIDFGNITATREYDMPDKNGMVALLDDIPKIQAGTNISIDSTDPHNPIISANADGSIILKTPDGTKDYRISIDNLGNIVTTQVL